MIITRPFRKPLWLVDSFIKKHSRIILIAAACGILILLFTKNLLPFIPQIKPKRRIGLVGQYNLNHLPPSVAQTIGRGLTQIDADGQIQPDLAESWQISLDNTIYTFFLNRNSLWADGSPIKAKDIQLEIPGVTINRPDEYTLELKLQEPYAPFLVFLSRPLFKNQTIGAGAFQIKSSQYSGQYLKSLELVSQKQNLVYRFYPSNEAAWLGFRLGEVDELYNLLINPSDERWSKKITLESKVNYQQYLAIIFNLDHPYFSSKPLRQALSYAIETKSASEDNRAISPLSPLSWAFNSKVKRYEFNPEQAQELYQKFSEEATYSGQLKLTLGTSQSFLDLAETIAAFWEKQLNLEINVKIVNSIEPDFEALLIVQEIPLDPDQHTLWHSTQASNVTHYSDLKIDKLLEDGRKTLDQTKRKEIYQDFQRFLVEDSPAVFLEHPLSYTIKRR